MGIPKIRGNISGAPIIRIVILFLGLYWGPPILRNYPIRFSGEPLRGAVVRLMPLRAFDLLALKKRLRDYTPPN